jgi:c-di-GMP-binding flagellar brake protein YcgR
MNLDRAFPVHSARISPEGQPNAGDEYRIVSSAPDRLTVESHRSALRRAPPPAGQAVLLESKMPDAIYRLKGRVETVATDNDVVTMEIFPLAPPQRIQRRRDFRINESVPMVLQISAEGTPRTLELQTLDLSAGGVKVRTTVKLDVGDSGDIKLAFPEDAFTLECRVRVARCIPMGGGHFDIGLQFTDPRPSDQDRIVRILMSVLWKKVRL